MAKFNKKIIAIIAVMICFFSLVGCELYSFTTGFSEFGSFIFNRYKYGDYSVPDPEIKLPTIKTYSPIIMDSFDNITLGTSDYIYAEKNDSKFVINKENKYFSVPSELEIYSVSGEYAVTIKNDKVGISRLPYFSEVISHSYTFIDIVEDTFLLKERTTSYVYFNEIKTAEVKTLDIGIYMNGIVVYDGTFCDTSLSKLLYNGYQITMIYSDMQFTYLTPQGMRVFYNGKDVPGYYYTVNNFVNGRARIQLDSKTFGLINDKGEILFTTTKGKIFDLYEGHHLYLNEDFISVMTENFEYVTYTYYKFAFMTRLFKNRLIGYSSSYNFFNIETEQVDAIYKTLELFNDDFIGVDMNGKFSIFNADLTVYKSSIEDIKFNSKILAAKIDGNYFLYQKETL